MTNERTFASLLGEAAMAVWGDMPRDIQEALFETAMKARPELRHTSPCSCTSATQGRCIPPSRPDAGPHSPKTTSAMTGRWSE